ncbi:MAG: M48 family metallopeptidase [Megasphaera sp.]|jgi:predicted metal-dependent hydrolase|uniref:M48 family metallopeptidase n=1 Tax=Megasphaera sueciensis TaxID=349094 RepID=UPI003CFFDF0E|nr:M48 family metallopeptidase [Megasphaera sp.]MCI1822957.1 M48 family metallopeptidase [Megasphaera sp.]
MKNIHIHQITLDNTSILYTWEKKDIKNINLRIRPDETVYISSPPHVSQPRIETFLTIHKYFILRVLSQIRQQKILHPTIFLKSKDVIYLLGKKMIVQVNHSRSNLIYTENNVLQIETPQPDDWAYKRSLYHKFLRQTATQYLPVVIKQSLKLVRPYGITTPPQFRQRLMKSRWGSCIPYKQRITLNTYLAVMPNYCTEYVVLHELCHLIHPNHSSQFYAFVEKIMPDWQKRKKAMLLYQPYCI